MNFVQFNLFYMFEKIRWPVGLGTAGNRLKPGSKKSAGGPQTAQKNAGKSVWGAQRLELL